MKRTIFGVLLVAACGFAQAADRAPALAGSCEALAATVEAGVRDLAFYSIDGTFDSSAARETNRQLQKVVASNVIQANLTLMQANRCALPKLPIDENAYRSAALKCFTAAKPKDGVAPECIRPTWTRNID
jgi:hypothetical protein